MDNEGENWYKMIKNLNYTFWWKMWPILGPNISGTKCDREKAFFSAERESIRSWWGITEIGIQSDKKNLKNGDHHHGTSIPFPNMGVPPSQKSYDQSSCIPLKCISFAKIFLVHQYTYLGIELHFMGCILPNYFTIKLNINGSCSQLLMSIVLVILGKQT